MAKYLNSAGVTYLWQKIKALLTKPFKVAGSDGSYTSVGGGSVAEHLGGYSAAFWLAFAVNVLGVAFYFLYARRSFLRNRLR